MEGPLSLCLDICSCSRGLEYGSTNCKTSIGPYAGFPATCRMAEVSAFVTEVQYPSFSANCCSTLNSAIPWPHQIATSTWEKRRHRHVLRRRYYCRHRFHAQDWRRNITERPEFRTLGVFKPLTQSSTVATTAAALNVLITFSRVQERGRAWRHPVQQEEARSSKNTGHRSEGAVLRDEPR